MFLVYFCLWQHIINYILQFIENHSVLVGIVTSVIVGSLWMHKFLKQKRAEAFFGFYARLLLCLSELQERLNEKNLLNISEPEYGNIFSLIYIENYSIQICPMFSKIDDNDLEVYKSIAIKIQDILMNTENNVYPKKADREKWYRSQQVLFSFCEFLTNDCYQGAVNKNNGNEPLHIIKCRELVNAIDYIKESICNTEY